MAKLPKNLFEKYPDTGKYEGKIAWLEYVKEPVSIMQRNENGKPIKPRRITITRPTGVILITVEGNVGYSMLNKNDTWDQYLGIKKALCKSKPIDDFRIEQELVFKHKEPKKWRIMNRIMDIIQVIYRTR
jgi:hypothetical protein